MAMSPHDAALAIVSHFPDLLNVDNSAISLVKGHVLRADGFEDFVQVLATQGPPGPNGGWARFEPIIGSSGKPATNSRGQTINRWKLSSETLASLPSFLAEILCAVKADPGLQGLCWTLQEGVVPTPGVTSPSGWSLRSLPPRYGVGISEVDYAFTGSTVQMQLNNGLPRHLGVYGEFLHDGQPIVPSYWRSQLPGDVSQRFETATMKYLGLLAPTVSIAGISVVTGNQEVTFALPTGSEGARVSFGGLGNGCWDSVTGSLGAIVTSVLDYAVPAILISAGASHGQDPWYSSLLTDADTLSTVMNTGDFVLSDPAITDTPTLLAALASRVDALLLDTRLRSLHDDINRNVGADAVENAAPYLNWIWDTLRALLTSDALPRATSQLLSSPAVFPVMISPTMVMDLQVSVVPDQTRGEWPDVADRYTVFIQDVDGVAQIQSGSMPIDGPVVPLLITFAGIHANGPVMVRASLQAETGWECATGTTTLDICGPISDGSLTATVRLTEIPVPITAYTQYQHKRKLEYDLTSGQYVWKNGGPATAVASSLDQACTSGKPALCAPVNITLQEEARCLGYSWKASGQGLPECPAGGGAVNVGYLFQNVGVVDPEAGIKRLDCSFIQQSYPVYDRGGDVTAAQAGTGHNFFLEAGTSGSFLRSVSLDDANPFNLTQKQSWGRFVEANLTKMVVHPGGFVVGVNTEDGKIEVVSLPGAPVADSDAPLGVLLSGPGNREGLLDSPVALDVTPMGLLLVLESGSARVQAFDVFGNPVPCFPNGSPFMELRTETGVQYLDIAVSPSGLIYVLSCVDSGQTASDYRLDVYTPDGEFLARTEGVSAARIVVDAWGRVYALNYESIVGPNARNEPSIGEWIPSPPTPSDRLRG